MNSYNNLLRIASSLSKSHPYEAYALESAVNSLIASERVAVVNPGIKTFEEHVQQVVDTLEDLLKECEISLKEFDRTRDFTKFLDEDLASYYELKKIMDRSKRIMKLSSSQRTAGFKDFFNDIKKSFTKKGVEDEESTTSYGMDEESMDDFVEGSREWDDASKYVESEMKENKDFFEGADHLVKELARIEKNPDEDILVGIIAQIPDLIKKGKEIIKGIYDYQKKEKKPAKNESEKPGVQIVEDELNIPVNAELKGYELQNKVKHYIDMLDSAVSDGDDKKINKYLKELFSTVDANISGKVAAAVRKQCMTKLVRIASENPRLRSVIVPRVSKILKK